jgi:hypothetical protein
VTLFGSVLLAVKSFRKSRSGVLKWYFPFNSKYQSPKGLTFMRVLLGIFITGSGVNAVKV